MVPDLPALAAVCYADPMLPPLENLSALPPDAVSALLLAEPEGQWFDRKSARIGARELAETLVAMANAEGGLIAVGLSGGVCEGVDGRGANIPAALLCPPRRDRPPMPTHTENTR